jgi:N utilization substance protein B
VWKSILKRRLARESALKVLFMVEVGKNDPEEAMQYILEQGNLLEKEQSFCRKLATGVLQNREELDSAILGGLLNWELGRLSATVRSILRLALYELLYLPEIPIAVIINEAIELTKSYHDQEAARFVNGVLDKIGKKVRLERG